MSDLSLSLSYMYISVYKPKLKLKPTHMLIVLRTSSFCLWLRLISLTLFIRLKVQYLLLHLHQLG